MLLAHQLVTGEAPPKRLVAFLHGILGSGANWRTFAKQILEARPDYGALLVDLRLHGESLEFSEPHTIEACARDVRSLFASLGVPVSAVLGHSFGGKVALEVARLGPSSLTQIFVVDSTPSARPSAKGSESTKHIVELLRELPAEFNDRAAFTAWMEERGVSRVIAMWLAMNVRPVPLTTRFVFRLDVAGIRALLEDYFARDLWEIPEAAKGAAHPLVHFIVGGRSGVVDDADRIRANAAASATLDVIAEADHWVHVDAAEKLRALVLGYLT